jgi:hypothetical protein
MLAVAVVVRQLRAGILATVKGFLDKLVFNGLIRMNSLQFLKWCMFLARNASFARGAHLISGFLIVKVVLVSVYACAMPLIAVIFLLRDFDLLETPKYRSKYQNMYSRIGFKKGKTTVLYYPLFLLKRLLMVAITQVFLDHPGIQLQCLSYLTTAYVLAYMTLRPHWSQTQRNFEMFNEALLMVLVYCAMSYTPFVQSQEAQFQMGYVEIAALILMILCNLSHVAYTAAIKFNHL